MNRRLPPDAFEFYWSLGADRSYSAVAERYGVSRATVARTAKQEDWRDRMGELERKARDASDKRLLDEMEAMRERHIKAARILQAKALEALRALPADKAVRAAAALNIGWKHELLLLGEPTERNAVAVEEIVKRESERWLTVARADAAEEIEAETDGEDA